MSDSENATTLPKVNGKPSRRTVLKAGAALVTAAAAAPAMAAPPHPDAELIQAWGDWIAIRQAHRDTPALSDEEDEELFCRPMDALEDKIAAITAHTHAGYAVKARMAFYWSLTTWNKTCYELAAYHKGPLPDVEEFDFQSRLLWQMVEQAESMGGAA